VRGEEKEGREEEGGREEGNARRAVDWRYDFVEELRTR
jgi:hypothetical protein